MKNFFNFWNNYLVLNIIGFIFLIVSFRVLENDPFMALDLFTIPLVCFFRAIFVKFFIENPRDEK